MRPGQSLSLLTASLLTQLENCFRSGTPDLVLAHGDTTTCFASAMSSFYHHIPFFHVEAGLRTRRLNAPFPEEFNRQAIAPIAAHHFAPTKIERDNLLRDGVAPAAITVTGSTVHDAIHAMTLRRGASDSSASPRLAQLSPGRPLVVITLHRREAAESLKQTLEGLRSAARERPDAVFVCPVHPNPSVQNAFASYMDGLENIILTQPLPYPQFISLLMRSDLVVTDSGGVQEEAAFLGKRVLLARAQTERLDGMRSGLAQLVGVESRVIHGAVVEGLKAASFSSRTDKQAARLPPSKARSASEKIADQVQRAIG